MDAEPMGKLPDSIRQRKPSQPCLTRHTPVEWDAIRPEFSTRYKNGLYTLKDIRRYFQGLGFDATERQYKRKIKLWRLAQTNIKSSDKEFMVRTEARRIELGKQTTFWINGQPVERRKLLDARKRMFSESDIVKSAGKTPSHITYKTPDGPVSNFRTTIRQSEGPSPSHRDLTIRTTGTLDQISLSPSLSSISKRSTPGNSQLEARGQNAYRCGLCHLIFGKEVDSYVDLDTFRKHLELFHHDFRIAVFSAGPPSKDNCCTKSIRGFRCLSCKQRNTQYSYWWPGLKNAHSLARQSYQDPICEDAAWDRVLYGFDSFTDGEIEILGYPLSDNPGHLSSAMIQHTVAAIRKGSVTDVPHTASRKGNDQDYDLDDIDPALNKISKKSRASVSDSGLPIGEPCNTVTASDDGVGFCASSNLPKSPYPSAFSARLERETKFLNQADSETESCSDLSDCESDSESADNLELAWLTLFSEGDVGADSDLKFLLNNTMAQSCNLS